MSKGIDVPIANLNTVFTDNLWTDKVYTKYGRIYRNIREGGISPEAFNAITGEYSDVLLNDKIDAHSFFDVQPAEEYTGNFNADVWVCFAVNLKKLYPSVTTEMATEYAHEDALRQIKKKNFKVTGLVRGFDAFSDYELAKPEDSMNPFYLFRFNTEVKYPINC
jgi:hypothetical protein